MGFEVWPAIDLLQGACVRLQQGDYARQTTFGDEPAAMAERWFAAGADRLHCVDLDAARSGSITNLAAIEQICRVAGDRPVQVGGGVRDRASIERLLAAGADRLVVGTSAVRQPAWFAEITQHFPERLVLGLDARDGMVATDGWQQTSRLAAVDLLRQMQQLGCLPVAVVFTDIACDGMLAGPNLSALEQVQAVSPWPVIASGGVTRLEDVERLVAIGSPGCIVGRALYEGHLALEQVLEIAGRSG